MGDGDAVDLPHLGLAEPGGLVGGHPHPDDPGLVPGDGVEGQGGAGFIGVDDPAVGHQTQLNQGLEAVAYAADQAVPPLQQLGDALTDGGGAEEGGDELAGAVRLVATGEAAGDEDHLALGQRLGEALHAAGNAVGAEIVDDQDLRLCPRVPHGLGSVILAVGAGEDGDQHPGLCHLHGGGGSALAAVAEQLHGTLGGGNVAGINALQLPLVDSLQRIQSQAFTLVGDGLLLRDAADDPAAAHVLGHLQQEGTVLIAKNVVKAETAVIGKAQAVAEGHLHHGLGDAAVAGGIGGDGTAAGEQLMHRVKDLQQGGGDRQALGVPLGGQEHHIVPGGLEVVGDNAAGFFRGDGEGHQGGRHVHILEGAAHGVLAADGADAQGHLGLEGPQQGSQRLAPARRLPAEPLKILLEGEVNILEFGAGGDQLADGFHHRQIGPVIGAFFSNKGVVAPGHQGAVVGVLLFHGDLLDHGLDGGLLMDAAEGHQHGAGPDGGVKALGQAPLGADVQVPGQGLIALGETGGNGLGVVLGLLHVGLHMLLRAIGIEKFPADVHNGLAVPAHFQPGLSGDLGQHRGLQVLLGGQGHEGLRVFGFHHHGHPFLRLADGKLGAVQTLVLLGHGVQVDVQPVGQLAHGNGYAAGAEVVAALDHAAGVAVAEQALELPLLRGVALLHLGPAALQRADGVGLGRAGGAAAAVTAGAAAQQNHQIPILRALPAHVLRRRGGNDGADLHALGGIAGMIQLIHDAGGKADLVAVGGIARGGGGHQLPLGQLAGQGLADRLQGVCRAGDAHGAVDIGAAGEGVTDGAADAGGRAAEGLNLRGVVVGLVLEQQQPGLLLPVHIHVDLHRAGVDLLGFIQLLQLACLFQIAHGDGGQVHQVDGLCAVQGTAGGDIFLIGPLDGLILKADLVDGGGEGGVAAVIGPVGVDHADLGDGGLPAFAAEVVLAEGDVVQVHGQAVAADEGGKLLPAQSAKAFQGLHGGGDVVIDLQGLGHVHGGLSGLHGVDDVFLDLRYLLGTEGAVEQVHLGGAHLRPLGLGDDLDALGGGVGPLVKLTGQILHGEHLGAGTVQRPADGIQLRLGQDGFHRVVKQLRLDVLHVVAIDDAQILQRVDTQQAANILFQVVGLVGQLLFLFHKYPVYHSLRLLERFHGPCADVPAAVGVFKMHHARECIGLLDGLGQGILHSGEADDPAAAGQQLAVGQLGPGHKGVGQGLRGNRHFKAGLVLLGVAIGGQDDAAGGFIGELHFRLGQGPLCGGPHHGEQVAFQKGQHHLGLRVAEAAVVFDHLGALGGQHQAEVQAAPEGPALGLHSPDGGQEDFLHAPGGDGLGVIGVGSHGAHAAGVQPLIVISGPLVVHGGHHGHHGLPVGKGQDRDLRPGEKFFNDHPAAALTEHALLHHGDHGLSGLLAGLGDDDALAQSQAIGLDHDGHFCRFQIAERRRRVVKALIGGGGDAIFLHQVLGKDLAAFDLGRRGSGAEAGNALLIQSVHRPQHQGVVRGNHGVVHLLLQGEGHNGRDILGPDGDALRVRGDAAIAGQGKNLFHFRVLFQLFDDGVFTAAAADHEKLHSLSPFIMK